MGLKIPCIFLTVEKIYGVFNYDRKMYSVFYYILYFPQGKNFLWIYQPEKYNIIIVDLTIWL